MASTLSDNGVQFGGNAASPQIISLATPTLNAGAMTVTLNPCTLTFRATSLTAGGVNTVEIGSGLSITIPSGATLGAVNATAARLAILVAYNSGTPVLCVANLAGGVNLDETTLISPTTISSGATSASTIYSASAVGASSPFRVVGFLDSTQATAGTYATAPTVIGGSRTSLGAMMTLGYGQTWQNVTGSRALNTTYYNTTGKPIFMRVLAAGAAAGCTITINGVSDGGGFTVYGPAVAIIPAGASYLVNFSGTGSTLSVWQELR